MKNFISIVFSLGLLLFSISCDENTKNKEVKSELALTKGKTTEKLQKISLEIEGMTCEIGCARTIQSKLSKKEGVKSAKVSFEDKRGVVEFYGNKITENQIVTVVNQIAGGDVYKVVKTTKME